MCSALRLRARTVLSSLRRAETEVCFIDTARFKRAQQPERGSLPASLLWAGFAKTSAREEGASQSPQNTRGGGVPDKITAEADVLTLRKTLRVSSLSLLATYFPSISQPVVSQSQEPSTGQLHGCGAWSRWAVLVRC